MGLDHCPHQLLRWSNFDNCFVCCAISPKRWIQKGTELDHCFLNNNIPPPQHQEEHYHCKQGFYPTSNCFWVRAQKWECHRQYPWKQCAWEWRLIQEGIDSDHSPPTIFRHHSTTIMIVSKDSTQLPTATEYVHKNEIIMDSILESSVQEDGNSFSMNVCCYTKREARPFPCTYLSL